jgi:hypothetical protein
VINERVVVGDGKTMPAKAPLSETISNAMRMGPVVSGGSLLQLLRAVIGTQREMYAWGCPLGLGSGRTFLMRFRDAPKVCFFKKLA